MSNPDPHDRDLDDLSPVERKVVTGKSDPGATSGSSGGVGIGSLVGLAVVILAVAFAGAASGSTVNQRL